jgi:predicted ATPase
MRSALARHDTIVRQAIEGYGGYVFGTGGDGFAAAFSRAADGVAAARDAQAGLAEEEWPDGAALRVRMGLHTGEVDERDGDYFGAAVNRAARLTAVANGGQIVCSSATAELLTGVELVDLGPHRLRDLSTPQRLYQIGRGAFSPLRSVDTVPTNLPTVRTELIGRSEEVAGLSALVERSGLVTLTGVGGVGKTRLALGVAAGVATGFPDGCWLVELAPVAEGAEVTRTVAAAMGAPVTDSDGLVRYLADRRALLVLDNCEHVLDAVADLVDAIVAAAPQVHVLGTSREPLGLDGEVVRRVKSLAVPDSNDALDMVVASPAVRLLSERAAAVADGFAVSAANAAAVVEICRHLDGIPLAIELAAARVRAMAPAEIAARLGERFRLLSGGSRRAQERHRTLAATVGWSHDLLSDDEKLLFRRLAVFPASFDLAAAEAVAGEERLDILENLVRLVDRSLVQYEPDAGRYRLLETLRQYGAERLVEAGETDAARSRHAEHFLRLVARLAPSVLDARYPAAHDVLTAELDNLRAVADWCIERGDPSGLLQACQDGWIFLFLSAPVDLAGWYHQIIEHADGLSAERLVDTMGRLAYLAATNLGDTDLALQLAGRAIGLADDTELDQSPWALIAEHQVETFRSRHPAAISFAERALAAADARGDKVARIGTLNHISVALAECNDINGADRCAQEGIRRAEELGQPALVMTSVTVAASNHLWPCERPDFVAAYDILTRHGTSGYRDDATATMWYDLQWGAALVGVHKPALSPLANAVRLADRHQALHALDLALRLLAVALAEGGRVSEAILLLTYSDANLGRHRVEAARTWVQTALDRALDKRNRAMPEQPTPVASRQQVMAFVNQLDAATVP